MKKVVLFLLAAAAVGLGAEEGRVAVSAPFVSRLKAAGGETGILLTWLASPDLAGRRLVYRAAQPIAEGNLDRAELVARLGPDANRYEDVPPDQQAYYYAVLLEDSQGRVYRELIPLRNVTSAGVRMAKPPSEQDRAARIVSLAAAAAGDSILLSFQPSRADRELLLFRSSGPMRSAEDLLAATSPVTLDAGSVGYTDYPLPGIDYYYAVVDAGLFKIARAELAVGQNSLASPVQVPLGSAAYPAALEEPGQVIAEGKSEASSLGRGAAPAEEEPPPEAGEEPKGPGAVPRTAPLPFLSISAAVGTGIQLPPAPFVLPKRVPNLKPATEKAVATLLAASPPSPAVRLEPQILPEDQGAGAGTEAYALREIAGLLEKDPSSAETKLSGFLSIKRSEDLTARAHFYLGQVYYLQKKTEQSILELLLARDRYYAAVQPWLDACLLELQAR